MRLPVHLMVKDVVATVAVATAVAVFVAWAVDAAPFGMSARAVGITVLVLGFIASAAAVVPDFDRLLQGNRAYLAMTSVLGFGALAAGVAAVWAAEEWALTALTGVLVALWAIATTHHALLARPHGPERDLHAHHAHAR